MTAHLPVDRALLCMIDGRLQLKRKAGFDKGRAFYCTIQHCDISHRIDMCSGHYCHVNPRPALLW